MEWECQARITAAGRQHAAYRIMRRLPRQHVPLDPKVDVLLRLTARVDLVNGFRQLPPYVGNVLSSATISHEHGNRIHDWINSSTMPF
jgi:hypothetical protein